MNVYLLTHFKKQNTTGTNKVIVTPYNPHNTYQTWSVSLPRIKLQPDNRYTLSVVGLWQEGVVKMCSWWW